MNWKSVKQLQEKILGEKNEMQEIGDFRCVWSS